MTKLPLKVFLENPTKSEQVRDFMEDFTHYVFQRSQENLVTENDKGHKITDSGFLMGSGQPPTWNGNVITTGYTAKYASDIEYGTPAHKPPIKALQKWVQRKLNIRNKKASLSVAFAVRNKIAKLGTDPNPFMRTALQDAINRYGLRPKA